MAISEHLPDVKVEIRVDGKALKEYQDHDFEEESERTSTRYIEAASGQNFSIVIELLPKFHFRGDSVSFEIHTDGKYTSCSVFRKGTTMHVSERKGPNAVDASNKLRYCFNLLETGEFTTIHCRGVTRLKVDQ